MTKHHSDERINGIDMKVLQSTVDAVKDDPELGKCRFRAHNKWVDGDHNLTEITDFYAAKKEMHHKKKIQLHADEPPLLAGNDKAANPVEHLLNALASCMTTSMVAHAAVRGIHIDELESELEGDIDLNGFLGLDESVPKGYTDIRIKFKVKADTDSVARLKHLTAFSPVFNTVVHGANVHVDVAPM